MGRPLNLLQTARDGRRNEDHVTQIRRKSSPCNGWRSPGIGLAAALAFAKEGARVVITGRDQATLDKAAAQLGEKVIAVRSDAGSVADGIKLATLLQQQGVMLDAVFINAGVAKFAPFEAVGEEMWDVTFNSNLKRSVLLNQGATATPESGSRHRTQWLDQPPHRHA